MDIPAVGSYDHDIRRQVIEACRKGEMTNSWVDVYYEAVDLYYGEPQHFHQKSYEGAKTKPRIAAQEHVKRIEVSLNHQLKQFFAIAPRSLRNRLFEKAFGPSISGEFEMVGADYDGRYDLRNATQPDFLFLAHDKCVAIEMKIRAKSDIEQVLKYALLALAVERKEHSRENLLLFMGKGSFSSLWREGFASVEDMRKKLESEKPKFMAGLPERFQGHKDRFEEIVSKLSFAFVNYSELAGMLDADAPPFDGSKGSEVYRNLVDGMVGELGRRGLT
jgi:hypothetical protein